MPIEVPNRNAVLTGILPDRLVVERVLYEAEAPILFLTKNLYGQLLLAYLADDSSGGSFTILTPITAKTLSSLERGNLPVREAIESAPAWLHWIKDGESKVWALDVEELPKEYLPQAGTPLLPEHEAILRTRAVGPDIVLGRMPASVVAFVADSTRKALKTLLDYILDAKSDGRPRDEHRSLYDLPIQSFAFSSFELSFGLPPEEGLFTSEQISQASEKLNVGLNWASGIEITDLEADSTEEREAILRAVLLLTPPTSGHITQIEISGNWIPRDRVTLNKASRKRVRGALRKVDSERLFTYTGRLGEIDTDKFTFILRDTVEEHDRSGSFSEDLLEEMIAFLTERVTIAGVERQGKLMVNVVVTATDSAQGPVSP